MCLLGYTEFPKITTEYSNRLCLLCCYSFGVMTSFMSTSSPFVFFLILDGTSLWPDQMFCPACYHWVHQQCSVPSRIDALAEALNIEFLVPELSNWEPLPGTQDNREDANRYNLSQMWTYHICYHQSGKGQKNQIIICDKPVVISFLFLRFDFNGWSKKCWVVDTFRKNDRSTTITHGSKHFPWPSIYWCSADVPRNHNWFTNIRRKIEWGKFASIDFVFLLKSTEVTWKRRRPDTSCLIFYWLWQSSPSISSSLQSPLSSSHLILTVSFQLKFLDH